MTASEQPSRHGDWLHRGAAVRTRRWALEEELLGRDPARANDQPPHALTRNGLSSQQSVLDRIETELDVQAQRFAELERRLEAIASCNDGHWGGSAAAPVPDVRAARSTVALRASQASRDHDYGLCRCDGFVVETPTGVVGVISGLRFGSRVDRPDLLAIEIGRLRPRLFLVPVGEVERVSLDEERVVLTRDPRPRPDLVHTLLLRVRGRPDAVPS